MLTVASVAACATAEPPGGSGPDARPRVDARTVDASLVDAPPNDGRIVDARPIDARIIDAPSPDAPPMCTPVVMQRLVNPNFDSSPLGTGWVEMRIDPLAPLITGDGAVHSVPNSAWMGGFEDGDDELRQDVMIPAGTTQLVLRGFWGVATEEIFGPFDFSTVQLTTPAGAVLDTALAIDDTDATANWTAFTRTFPQPFAGQTVRLRIRSSADGSIATSFFYDDLLLEATVCQ